MYRRLIISFLLILCAPVLAAAQNDMPLFEFGIEWGSTSTLYSSKHQNYTSDEGYRINETHSGWTFMGGGYFTVNLGVNATRWLNLGINTGFAGITEGRRAIPLTARATIYPKGMSNDGILCFFDGGVGFTDYRQPSKTCTLLSAGTGYHFAFSRLMGMNLICKIRFAGDHPDIIDIDSGKTVPSGRIRENKAGYWSLNFGIALDF